MVLGCSAVLAQVYHYEPKRSPGLLLITGLVSIGCFAALILGGLRRDLLFPYSEILGLTGVVASFLLLHLGSLDQFRLNRMRKSVKDLSLQKEVLHFLDWGVWLIYPALLGLQEHWAPFVNAAVGFLATSLLLFQFKLYGKHQPEAQA
jgi:high-affinity Fe2+/Pb2+ permease